MRTIHWSVLTACFICFTVHAQHDLAIGVRVLAMGGASCALPAELWGVRTNPASIGGIRSVSASAFAVPALFGMTELKTIAVSVGAPLGSASVGGCVSRFGFELYHETSLSLGCAVPVVESVCLGAALHGLSIAIARYGSTLAWKVDLGLVATLREDLWIGIAVRPVMGELPSIGRNQLNRTLVTGISFSPESGSILHLELEQEQGFAPAGKLGLEYTTAYWLTVRMGAATLPETFSAGFGLRLGMLEFGYALWSHRDLGWSHAFELQVGAGVLR